jgi:hypothetical protein
MILRRIISHFRKQEWTAIGIDFLIVVVGVLVATEVSNWNATRLMRQQGAEFSERLVTDLREEAWGYQFYIEYYDEVLANAERALAVLERRTSMSDETLLIAAYRATQYKRNVRRRATYDELTSTGAIGLIEDAELRGGAMRIFNAQLLNDLALGEISQYRERFRMIVPMEAQDALADACGDRIPVVGDYRSIVDSLDYECALDLQPSALREAAAALRADQTLLMLLRLRVADLKTTVGNLATLSDEFQPFLDNAEAASAAPN